MNTLTAQVLLAAEMRSNMSDFSPVRNNSVHITYAAALHLDRLVSSSILGHLYKSLGGHLNSTSERSACCSSLSSIVYKDIISFK